jgi:hypothetical protein
LRWMMDCDSKLWLDFLTLFVECDFISLLEY